MSNNLYDMSNNNANDMSNIDMDELAAMFGMDAALESMNNSVISQDLEGFASCFPDWDLHPPVGK